MDGLALLTCLNLCRSLLCAGKVVQRGKREETRKETGTGTYGIYSCAVYCANRAQAEPIATILTDPHRSPPVPTGPHRSPPVPTGPHRSPPVPTGPHRSPPVPTGPHQSPTRLGAFAEDWRGSRAKPVGFCSTRSKT